ncbi:MAG: hypothetical protein JW726_04200 [Anaerolineales bacterium]|nr:hypothetical protein [Anaerolineales bacterium]
MHQHRTLQFALVACLALLAAMLINLPILAAVDYAYVLIPDADYEQGDGFATLRIYAGADTINPTRVEWLSPTSVGVDYCETGGCGSMYSESVGDDGQLIWREFYFYIAGQGRANGTYTAVVYETTDTSNVDEETELLRAHFTISGQVVTPTLPSPLIPVTEPDPDFDQDGIVFPTLSGQFSVAYAVALQPDGKILAAGYQDEDFALLRFLDDGSPDSSFGSGGVVITSFTDGFGDGKSVVVQADGKIIVAGIYDYLAFALARYNSDGSPDATFGSAGIVITTFSDFGGAHAIALQEDGKIVVAGYTYEQARTPGLGQFALARYNTDGSLDASFGAGGKATTEFPEATWNDQALSLAIQEDGKIVLAGRSAGYTAVARYNANGSLDTTFGSGGMVTTEFGLAGYGVVIQKDGKIVVAGGTRQFALLRLLSDGSRDPDFGSDGEVVTYFGGDDALARGVALLPDGRIVAAGYQRDSSDSDYDFALAIYNKDGSLYTREGTSGWAILDLGWEDLGRAVTLQPDGAIIIAGESNSHIALARFLPVATYYYTMLPLTIK